MSEQYRCKSCGYVFDMKDMMCSECGIGYFERLHWTKGGDGSHREGCAEVHWDCRIAQLEKENARLTAELAEDEFDRMPIEKINQYLREHGYDPEKVGLRGKILAEALTKNIIAREIIQRFLNNEGGCRFCEYDKYLPLDAPKNGHEENCLYLAARAYLDNDTSTVVKRDLSDAEIEELGAQEAESRGDK